MRIKINYLVFKQQKTNGKKGSTRLLCTLGMSHPDFLIKVRLQ